MLFEQLRLASKDELIKMHLEKDNVIKRLNEEIVFLKR